MAVGGPDNSLYVSSQFNNSIIQYPLAGSTYSSTPSATYDLSGISSSYSPAGLKFGSDGNLYVARNMGNFANPGTGSLDRFNSSGVLQGTVLTGLSQPSGLTLNGGNLYVSERIGANANGYGDILRVSGYTTATPTVTTFVTTQSGGLENPTGMAFGPDGKLYVADVGGSSNGVNCAIRRYNSDGSPDPTFSLPLAFQFPAAVAFNSAGQLLVANLGTGQSPSTVNGNVLLYDLTGPTLTPVLNTTIASNTSASAFEFVPVPEPTLILGCCAGLLLAVNRRGQGKR